MFLIFFLFLNFKNKAWAWILFALITVVITDQTSSHFIKTFIQRPRPCVDDYLQFHVRLLLDHCSGGYSFTSSHATNHFGFAVFVFITLKEVLKKWKWLFIFWAATISYGQVYVGVHYPLDVLCGGMMGALIGWLTAKAYLGFSGPITNPSQSSIA
jgi:undecaprenyl-diphosphatase